MALSFLDRMKCRLGLHRGLWVYENDDDCVQLSLCEDCGTGEMRVQHVWQQDEADSWVCICEQCGEVESSIYYTQYFPY